eukprot:TRINITY_DN29198_c0_g2_i1.p1 TRINITY_DN29198_c0_g2~~TRINITY_DN29198_c0_g2_i1.p1  ORF type:complete len:361 (-),score=65.12 TRINITY_DN29198_c0_g2_i1:500-1465(-)
MPMPSRRSSDVAVVLNRLLAEEREVLANFVYNSHMALTKKLECHLDAVWDELPPLPDAPSEMKEYLAQMETCGQVKEPNADSSLPEVDLDAMSQSVPSKMDVKMEGKADFKDCIQTSNTYPATDDEGVVEQRSVVVLHELTNDAEAGGNVDDSGPGSNRAMGPKTSWMPAAGIRGRDDFGDSRGIRILRHPLFEIVFASMTFINAVTMGLEQQFIGFDTGYKLQAPGYTRRASEIWPNGETHFVVTESVFGIIFTFEVIFKVFVLRYGFFRSWWNLYDTVIIGLWFLQNLTLLNLGIQSPLVMRLVKLGRLLRLLRFVKSF